jgi:hypothetical protein
VAAPKRPIYAAQKCFKPKSQCPSRREPAHSKPRRPEPRPARRGNSPTQPHSLLDLAIITSRRCSSFFAEAAVLVLVFGIPRLLHPQGPHRTRLDRRRAGHFAGPARRQHRHGLHRPSLDQGPSLASSPTTRRTERPPLSPCTPRPKGTTMRDQILLPQVSLRAIGTRPKTRRPSHPG